MVRVLPVVVHCSARPPFMLVLLCCYCVFVFWRLLVSEPGSRARISHAQGPRTPTRSSANHGTSHAHPPSQLWRLLNGANGFRRRSI